MKMQFSRRKAEYVIEVAKAAAKGDLPSEVFQEMPLENAVERLCKLRGVGRWSAEQALYRGLGRIEALPGGDLGVQKVVALYCFGEKRVDEKKVRETASRWAPWGSLATAYLFAAWRAGVPPQLGMK
jgi:DNA-3-methyladenine glycosylase II